MLHHLRRNPYLLILLLPLAFGCICGGPYRYYDDYPHKHTHDRTPPIDTPTFLLGQSTPPPPVADASQRPSVTPDTPLPAPLVVAGVRPGMHLWTPDTFPSDDDLHRLGALPGVLVAARVEPRFVASPFDSPDALLRAAENYHAGLLLVFRVEAEISNDADPTSMPLNVRTTARAIAELIDARSGRVHGTMTSTAHAVERIDPTDDERTARARDVTLTRATRDALAGLSGAVQREWPLH